METGSLLRKKRAPHWALPGWQRATKQVRELVDDGVFPSRNTIEFNLLRPLQGQLSESRIPLAPQ